MAEILADKQFSLLVEGNVWNRWSFKSKTIWIKRYHQDSWAEESLSKLKASIREDERFHQLIRATTKITPK